MKEESVLILAAAVSRRDRRALEIDLKEAGFEARGVDGAEEAAADLAAHAGHCVLVIDSGLLGMPHDGQWRLLRERHPELGAVVRCLIPWGEGIEPAENRTIRVHPDHAAGLVEAIRILAGEAPRA